MVVMWWCGDISWSDHHCGVIVFGISDHHLVSVSENWRMEAMFPHLEGRWWWAGGVVALVIDKVVVIVLNVVVLCCCTSVCVCVVSVGPVAVVGRRPDRHQRLVKHVLVPLEATST